jgi:hypothetical protein
LAFETAPTRKGEIVKHLAKAATAAMFAAASGSAFAQEPPAPAPAPGLPAGADQGAAPAAAPDFAGEIDVTADMIIAALANTQAEIGELGGLAAGATIRIVPLSQYLTGPDAAPINEALTEAEGQRNALLAALQANVTVMAQLQSEIVALDDIVGVDVSGNEILVFTRAEIGGNALGGGAAIPGP